MGAKIELLIDYETLVAVVREALPGKFHWVDFDEESMLGCTVFKLRQRQLGDNLGEVMVRKVVDRSDLSYHGPQRLLDRRDPTQEEIDTLKAARPDMDWLQRGDELWRKIREEGDELHRRREEHFGKVIKAMFSGLYHNPILQRALLAEGNVLQLKFLARLAGEELELPQPTEAEPQVDSGAVGEEATAAEDEDSSLIKILFLAANPADTDHLRLDAEMRAIDLALQQAAFRDRFELRQHWAVQVTDLQHCLLRHQPDIVHFSGHGSVLSEIILEDVSGNSRPVSVRALSTLFSILKDNIKCVVLNACYSEQQAQAIAQSIDCVIGMSKVIGDDAAIGFATAFYQALGFGRDVKTAFELGRVQIDLEGLDEQDTPKLLALKIPPENIFFIKQAQ